MPLVEGGVTIPTELIFGPLQVPPVGEKLVTKNGLLFGQAALGGPALIALTVTTTISEHLPFRYVILNTPLPAMAGLNVPLLALVIPLPDQLPPLGFATRLNGPLDWQTVVSF